MGLMTPLKKEVPCLFSFPPYLQGGFFCDDQIYFIFYQDQIVYNDTVKIFYII